MSYFKNYETEYDDQDLLLSALNQMDLAKKVSVLKMPRKLRGYGKAEAEIVLPRGAFGNQYDAGFARQANGTYSLVAADDDIQRFNQDRLKQEYGVAKSVAEAKSRGLIFKRRENSVDAEKKPQVKLFFATAKNG